MWSMTQVIDCLPNKHKALSLILNTDRKRERERERENNIGIENLRESEKV
jgi:hypothetical protein